ncbi:paralemmin-3 [Pseudochaenichthys georgianus]|uniref:paralemmin-3 n=1 Tax=Pseudochaenichthys georgianus TaxID=52239 RepID=UPI00146C0EE3|nr:paralemmin-3 [Pseudochaenichthys georgianus]
MDETEKYKQRLEAIAEKRRLQEEQDRERREMEDEKLRLQQLKRKSLRDQWLMEAPPLSPSSADPQSPRSPLWGSQAQEIEKRIDRLQPESQWLAEEEEKLNEQMEDGQTEAVKVAEAAVEMVRGAVVQNGENNATGLDEEVKENLSTLPDEPVAIITNGGGNLEHITNGDSEGDISVTFEPGSSLGVSEGEPGQGINVNNNDEEEEEEGILVMRAERVIITDEGEDVPDDLTSQDAQQESIQTPLPNEEECRETETVTQPEKSEATAEANLATGEGEVQGNQDGETKAEGQDQEDLIAVQLQSPASALEGSAVASVPVYSEGQPPTFTTGGEAAMSAEEVEAEIKARVPATLLGQFQEVPLAGSRENLRTEAPPGEQEPLLSQAKAPDTRIEPAAAVSTKTQNPHRAGQGEETRAPKHKSCQCCSVM